MRLVRRMAEVSAITPIEERERELEAIEREASRTLVAYRSAVDAGGATPHDLRARRGPDA